MTLPPNTPTVNPSLEAPSKPLMGARATLGVMFPVAYAAARERAKAAGITTKPAFREALMTSLAPFDWPNTSKEQYPEVEAALAAMWPPAGAFDAPAPLVTDELKVMLAAAREAARIELANKKTAADFVEQLTGSPDAPIRLRLIHDSDKTKPCFEIEGTIPALWPQVQERQREGYGVFYFVNAVTPGLEGFARDQNVTACRAHATDHDGGLPEDFEWHVKPTLIVKTSRVPIEGKEVQKGQALWIAGVPVVTFKTGQQRLAAHYGTDPKICNLARILRLPGSYHLKDPARPQLVTFEVTGERCTPEAIMAGVAQLPPREKKTAAGKGKRVSWSNLRARLSYIHPQFDGTRPACYPQPDHKKLSYDSGVWLAIALCLRDGDIPLLDTGEHDWLELIEQWSDGTLWFERTGEKLAVTTFPDEGTDLRLRGDKREGGDTSSVAVIIKYAGDAGCPLPPDDEPKPTASEVFKGVSLTDHSEGNDKAEAGVIQCIDAADMLMHDPKPLEEVIPGLIEKNIATMLAGAGSTHKSRTLLHWCAAIHTGTPIYGRAVIPATALYLDYENGEEEMCRRLHMIQKRLLLPSLRGFKIFDLKAHSSPLANVTPEGVVKTQWADWLGDQLCKIKGHKFIGADSCYNILRFTGQSKIDETLVKEAINFLDNFCKATDSTMVFLWHPSYSGQERGDASGWSVAWNNAPRGRDSMTKAKTKDNKVIPGAFTLKVEKRNNGPEGEEIPLFWANGLLLPKTQIEVAEIASRKTEACIRAAIQAVAMNLPIKMKGDIEPWRLNTIERECGERLSSRDVKAELAHALDMKRLRYVKGKGHIQAGYYAWDDRKVDPDQRQIDALLNSDKPKNGATVPGQPGELVPSDF